MTPRGRLLFIGDVHGNIGFVKRALARAKLNGIDAVIQVGDWGAWWPRGEGVFENAIAEETERQGIPLYWIKGNHDNHTRIEDLIEDKGWASPINCGGQVWYLPNGCRIDIAGVVFGVLGGAHSVDYRLRIPGVSWWDNEIPTKDEVERLGTERVDVLLTHDGPEKLSIYEGYPLPDWDENRCEETRRLIREAARAVKPHHIVAGHHHYRWNADLLFFYEAEGGLKEHNTKVFGLAHDGNPENAAAIMEIPGCLMAFTDILKG